MPSEDACCGLGRETKGGGAVPSPPVSDVPGSINTADAEFGLALPLDRFECSRPETKESSRDGEIKESDAGEQNSERGRETETIGKGHQTPSPT